MAPFTIIAHRGHQGRAPENTLQAFQAALDAGYPHFELDVQLTSCGTAIVLHDEHLGRTVPGSGPVADNSWEELKDKDAGSWVANVDYARLGITDPASSVNIRDYTDCRIPTLTAVLDAFLGKAHIHLVSVGSWAKEQMQASPGPVATPCALQHGLRLPLLRLLQLQLNMVALNLVSLSLYACRSSSPSRQACPQLSRSSWLQQAGFRQMARPSRLQPSPPLLQQQQRPQRQQHQGMQGVLSLPQA